MTFREVMKRAMAVCRAERRACEAAGNATLANEWAWKWSRIASRYEREPVRAAEEAERQRDEDEALREDADEARREMGR